MCERRKVDERSNWSLMYLIEHNINRRVERLGDCAALSKQSDVVAMEKGH